jgi:cold shock CspA family protein
LNSGRIKWISPDLSYGYILLYDGDQAYFNSHDFLYGDLAAAALGDEVSFELLRTEGGFEAFNIQTFALA